MHQRKERRSLFPQQSGYTQGRVDEETATGAADAERASALSVKLEIAPSGNTQTGRRVKLTSPPKPPPPLKRFQLPPEPHWEWEGTVTILRPPESTNSSSVASFDFEGTLVTSHRVGASPDWSMKYDEVPKAIQRLYRAGSKIAIITAAPSGALAPLQARVAQFINAVMVPIEVYISVVDDHRRKPQRATWDMLLRRNGGVEVSTDKSFHVGANAGRPEGWADGMPADQSVVDRKFAHNCGIAFHTPEEYFLGHGVAPYHMTGGVADMCDVPHPTPGKTLRQPERWTNDTFSKAKQEWTVGGTEAVLFVGCPAAGKSTFAQKHFVTHGYNHINQDRLGSREKCLAMMRLCLEKGQRVVIDNTNPDKATRRLYVAMAQRFGVPIRCFWLDTSRKLAQHLNEVRVVLTDGRVRPIPNDAYERYFARFEDPGLAEGFSEIRAIRFRPVFDSDRHRQTFMDHVGA